MNSTKGKKMTLEDEPPQVERGPICEWESVCVC